MSEISKQRRMPALEVVATWDDEAAVWVAVSDDVPGLATDAPSLEALVEKLKVMVPELLEANGLPGGDVPVTIRSERTVITHRLAA